MRTDRDWIQNSFSNGITYSEKWKRRVNLIYEDILGYLADGLAI